MSRLLALIGFCVVLATSAAAQGVLRVAAIVNDDVISIYDLEMRLIFVLRSARLEDNIENRRRLANQVLRSLVDERLQIQEANKANITASDADYQRAYRFLEQQNGVAPGRLDDFLRAEGVDKETLKSQIQADIVWNKLMLARMRSSADVSDEEIDDALRQIQKSAGKTENLVSEIFLPVDSPEQDEEVRRTAQRLMEQIRAGAAFGNVARQFSRGSTAAQGGDVGWVIPGQLADEVDRTVQELPVNTVSEPIRTLGGYYLIAVRERRQGLNPGQPTALVELKQVLLAMPPNASQPDIERNQALARTIQQATDGCDKVEAVAKQNNATDAGTLGKMPVQDLPDNFRQAIANAPTGKLVGPVRTNAGLHLLMVCSRETAAAPGMPSRDQISERLMQRRINMFSRRYLRDLRRTAIVEVR